MKFKPAIKKIIIQTFNRKMHSATYPRCGVSAAGHQQVKSRMKVQIISSTKVSVVVPDDLSNRPTTLGESSNKP